MLIGAALLLTAVLAATVALPRTVDTGTTSSGQHWRVEVVPRVRTPLFRVEFAAEDVRLSATRRSGHRRVVRRVLDDPVTGRPAMTVLVGTAPLTADSVRITTAGRGVREATIRLAGWQRVHATVFDGEVVATEIAAIGADGEVLEVIEASDATGATEAS